MKPFRHFDADSVDEALALLNEFGGKARVTAGGTDLLGVLKSEILPDYPQALINLKTISGLDGIEVDNGGVRIGALARLADIADSPVVKKYCPALALAAASVGSPELRNMGTIGGNLCQDTRCWYYRYPDKMGGRVPCYRKGKGPCHAIRGDNRISRRARGQEMLRGLPVGSGHRVGGAGSGGENRSVRPGSGRSPCRNSTVRWGRFSNRMSWSPRSGFRRRLRMPCSGFRNSGCVSPSTLPWSVWLRCSTWRKGCAGMPASCWARSPTRHTGRWPQKMSSGAGRWTNGRPSGRRKLPSGMPSP